MAPVSTKTSVRIPLTKTSMDDEDRGDGFFLYLEVSPPRYLLSGFFVVDKIEQCVPADGMHALTRGGSRGRLLISGTSTSRWHGKRRTSGRHQWWNS